MPSRWVRLDVCWEDADWLDALDGTAAGCWPRVMCLVKRDGVRGACKRPSLAVVARRWRVPIEAVQALEEAAIAAGALERTDDEWRITTWDDIQPSDATAAERMRRHRKERSRLSPLRRNTVTDPEHRDNPVTLSRATETETERVQKDADASSSKVDTAASVQEVFEHWVAVTGRDAARTQLTPTRRDKIKARLKESSVADLKRAIDGVMKSEHHRSKAEYTDLTSCFRSAERVENHIARANGSGGRTNGTGRVTPQQYDYSEANKGTPQFKGFTP
jgi:hypothetical protein